MNILFTTSTLPRWEKDNMLSVVLDIAKNTKKCRSDLGCFILAPHYPGAKKTEMSENIKIYRYRYFLKKWQKLSYGSGISENIRKNKFLVLLLPSFLLCQILAIKRIVRAEKISLIHAHWLLPQGLAAVIYKLLFNRKIKIVLTAHGVDGYGLQSGLFVLVKKFVLKEADTVSAVSGHLAAEIEKITDKKVRTIRNGVDCAVFKPQEKNQDLRDKYDIKSFCLLFVGRLVEKKGAIYLIKAMPEILKTFPDTKLLVAGDGREYGNISGYVAENDLAASVILLGGISRSDLPAYYNLADIFIGPSIVAKNKDAESFGIVFIEALACGIPVIATATGGIGEIVNETVGYIVEEKSSRAIAKQAVAVLKDPDGLARKKALARDYAAKKFGWEKIAAEYLDIYARLIIPE